MSEAPMAVPPPDEPTTPDPPPIPLPAADLPPLLEPADGLPVLQPEWTSPRPRLSTRAVLFFAVLGFGSVLFVLMLVVGGPAGKFAMAGIQVLPFLGLVLLAYAGERNDTARILTVVYWGLLTIVAVLFITMFTALAAIDMPSLLAMNDAARAGRQPPGGLAALFPRGGAGLTAATFFACVLAALAGAWTFTPTARRAAGRAIQGFDAGSFVHAVALATVVGLTLMLLAPLTVTGEPPLLTFIRHVTDSDFGKQAGGLGEMLADENMMLDQVFSFAWLVPMCVVAVGWPLHRTLPAALRRVGFVVPTIWQVLLGVWLAIVLAFAMIFLDKGIGRVWDLMHWPRTDEKAVEQLFKAMTSPLGAVVIGVTAGVGEELFARGVLQPRLGILLSNLFFTSLHALQYSWDGLLSVFLIGVVLGVVRKGSNTTTSAIVHGVYDFVLVMAAVYGFDPAKEWFGW
jgi:membrane protease YdiL (CAAX protease family)